MAINVVKEMDPIPVSVITGFLGSGKTTLLNALLQHPDMGETAVMINEFGEIGLDHMLVETLDEDVVLLNSGCLCCTVRGDLVKAMRDLLRRRMRDEVPPFRRVVVETTGLADPAPILHTLMTDLVLQSRFRIDGIVTTIDAVHGAAQLDDHPESIKQAAVADRLVLTKSDLADEGTLDGLRDRLGRLNPGAPVIAADHGAVAPDALFNAGLYDPETKIADVARWLNEEAYDAHHHHQHDVNRHDDRIRAFCLSVDEPISWPKFTDWIETLLATRGEDILRIKGVLQIAGEAQPVVVHGVQHMFHPPALLSEWPRGERCSRIVFITRDVGQRVIEETFRAIAMDGT